VLRTDLREPLDVRKASEILVVRADIEPAPLKGFGDETA